MLDTLQFDERSRPVYEYIVAVRNASYTQPAEVEEAHAEVEAAELDTYEAMRRYDHVTSVKEAFGLLPRTAQLVEMGYSVYSGDDVATLGYLAYGGVGLVSVVAHAAGDQLASMIDAWVSGDHAEALRIHTSLLPAFDAVMGVPNYGATTAKAALELLGVLDNRRVRGPLVALDDHEVAALRTGLAAAGLI